MSALSDALRAAQAQTIAAMSRAFTAGYVHGAEGQTTGEAMAELLDSIGCTDRVEQGQLLAALEALRGFGVQGEGKPSPNGSQGESEAATDAQWKLLRRLSDERGRVAPDGPLTKTEASNLITALKGGAS